MFRETVNAKQLGSWCFAAVVPTAIQLSGGMSWTTVAALCAVSVAAVWAVKSGGHDNRFLCALRFVFFPILLAHLLPYASSCWPGDDKGFVAVSLLAIAAWSAGKGIRAAARAGAVLFWAVLLLYLAVLATGARQIEIQWLKPIHSTMKWDALTVLLIPAVAISLITRGEKPDGKLYLSTIYIICGAAIIMGVLSPAVAVQAEDAFYLLSKSINLFGFARHFEAVVSAGMTVGWFSLASILLTVAGQSAEKWKPGCGRWGVFMAAIVAAVLIIIDVALPSVFAVSATGLIWVGIPIIEGRMLHLTTKKKI